MGRILLVDDDPGVLRAYSTLLVRAGHTVATAADGAEALAHVRVTPFDVVVSDIAMPGMSGVELLSTVRRHDLDVPVVMITGTPALDTAIAALEQGAYRYLVKPVSPKQLLDTVGRAIPLGALARLKREALELAGLDERTLGDRASLETRFRSAMASLWIAFQPIVRWRERSVHAWEALLRTDEPTLRRPDDFLSAAERLGRMHDLGRLTRSLIADAIPDAPAGALVFINVHARELDDEHLYDADSPLAGFAARVVVEVTERCSLDGVRDVPAKAAALRGLGFRLAIDDLAAGYAGLQSFALLEPDVVKIDMSLVRGIDVHPTKQRLVRSMVQLCAELGIGVVCEGVETEAERDTLAGLGADLLQGFLFARPALRFPQPVF